MELLLINHPLDCPVCDKGGECPLQNQAMSNGRTESRFVDVKRTYPKPLPISSQVLLDRERCVLCARCTRFSAAGRRRPVHRAVRARRPGAGRDLRGRALRVLLLGQHHADLPGRRADQRASTASAPARSTCAASRASASTARPAAPSAPTTGAARSCAGWPATTRRSTRSGTATRAADAFRYATANDRLTTPLVAARTASCSPRPGPRPGPSPRPACSPPVRTAGVGVLPGGRLTVEDAYAYAKFARVALGTNDVDARARAHSARGGGVPRRARRRREPGHRGGHLRRPARRLRRPARRLRARGGVADRLPAAAPGGAHQGAAGLRPRAVRHAGRPRSCRPPCSTTLPGAEAQSLRALADGQLGRAGRRGAAAARRGRAGRRAAGRGARCASPPLVALAAATGARVAWVPRRAGERGAVEAGALPNLLPGGRGVADAAARAEVAAVWGWPTAALGPGPRHRPASSPPSATGGCPACSSAASTPPTCPTRRSPRRRSPRPASWSAWRCSRARSPSGPTSSSRSPPRSRRPAATSTGRAGVRPFDATLHGTGQLPDGRVLHGLADEMDVDLGLPAVEAARAELAALGHGPPSRRGRRARTSRRSRRRPLRDGRGRARHLAPAARRRHAAARRARARRHRPPAGGPDRHGRRRAGSALADGDRLTVSGATGSVTLPVRVTAMPDRVVWLPMSSPGSDGPHATSAPVRAASCGCRASRTGHPDRRCSR